jgi:hypothetical protein
MAYREPGSFILFEEGLPGHLQGMGSSRVNGGLSAVLWGQEVPLHPFWVSGLVSFWLHIEANPAALYILPLGAETPKQEIA